MFNTIGNGLNDAYKHKPIKDAVCIVCGRKNVPLALHVIEFYHSDTINTPPYLIPMSQSLNTTRGSVPICNICCPECKKCSLPIANSWVKKLLGKLSSRHKSIKFVIGNGFCRHIHIFYDLMSLFRSTTLKDIDSTYSQKLPISKDYQWKNKELSIYFKAQPRDLIWGTITEQKAETIQEGFLEILRKTHLDKYHNTNTLEPEIIDTICEIANNVGKKNDLNPIFIILLAHQYIDADQIIRQIHKHRWTASMVSRSDFAPTPESYMKYIKSTYFSGDD